LHSRTPDLGGHSSEMNGRLLARNSVIGMQRLAFAVPEALVVGTGDAVGVAEPVVDAVVVGTAVVGAEDEMLVAVSVELEELSVLVVAIVVVVVVVVGAAVDVVVVVVVVVLVVVDTSGQPHMGSRTQRACVA
jgi:hypothetical protein